VWLACAPGLSSGSEAPVSMDFSVKPRLCILSEDTERCEQQVSLAWKSSEPLSLCLYSSQHNMPSQCWEDAVSGELQMELDVEDTVIFQLRDYYDDLRVLAGAEFKVVRDKKKYRRSRRNPWSFF